MGIIFITLIMLVVMYILAMISFISDKELLD